MLFRDRADAGLQLARILNQTLTEGHFKKPVVLAVPRGAVPMSRIIADELGVPLDVVLVHKIGAPDNPELAVGSVTEFGDVFSNEVTSAYGFSQEDLHRLAEPEAHRLQKRRRSYNDLRQPLSLRGQTVIIVDDGIATGATILAAIRSIKKQKPAAVVVAAAVAPPETVRKLQAECDRVVTLAQPDPLYGVGLYFDDFSQVTDDEVEDILRLEGEKTQRLQASAERRVHG